MLKGWNVERFEGYDLYNDKTIFQESQHYNF